MKGAAPVATLALVAAAALFSARRIRAGLEAPVAVAFEPTLVIATLRLDGVVVRGAAPGWASHVGKHLRYGDAVPVWVTAYCLKGLTRRDRYVRQGIVASDPKIFPLSRYIEIYVGRKYFGRFLVDDTGKHIKGNRLDIWTPTCREARLFGRQKGTAVLVPRPRGARADTLLTGRLKAFGSRKK